MHAVKRRTLLQHSAALGLAATLPLGGRAQTREGREGRIVLGQSAALTGPAAQLGLQFNRGARLVFDRVNANGGVGGAQIELKALDDGYEPDRCRANTERFLAEDVFALFGYVGTPTTLAALPLVTSAKVPLIAPLTGAMGLRVPFNRNVFHIRASYDDETALIVKHLTQLGLKKIGVFRQNDSYGQAGLDGVTKALQQRQLTPLAVGTVERNSRDVAAAVKTLVAARPDAIVLISAYTSCAAFIRAARQAGYGGTFFNVSFVGTQALSDALGHEALGVMVTQVVPSPFSTTSGVVRDYLAALKAADPKLKPNYTSLEGYIAARVLVDGLNRGGRGRDGLVSALEGLGSLQLGGFPLSFSARDHVGSHFVEVTMLTGDGGVRT